MRVFTNETHCTKYQVAAVDNIDNTLNERGHNRVEKFYYSFKYYKYYHANHIVFLGTIIACNIRNIV